MSWIDARNGSPRRSGDWYDTKQVCLNGHQITDFAQSQPQGRRAFCDKCGAATIEACPSCHGGIRGFRHLEGVFYTSTSPIPKYCADCGKPFPWQQAALDNLKEVLIEGGLSEEDVASVGSSMVDVVNDTPKTDGASLRVKRLVGKLGGPAYEIAIKVVTDLASEAAKKTMGLK